MIQRDAAAPHVPAFSRYQPLSEYLPLVLVFAIGRLCFLQVTFWGGPLQEMESLGASFGPKNAELGGSVEGVALLLVTINETPWTGSTAWPSMVRLG